MSHWRGPVVSFLSFWAFTVLLVVLLFQRGKAAEAGKIPVLTPPPEISAEVTNLAAVSEAEIPEPGASVRRHYTAAERRNIRHATINVPQ